MTLCRVYCAFIFCDYITISLTFMWCCILQGCFTHDDVIKWKHVSRYWPFVRRIHRWPVNSLHKDQWRGAFWINGWVNNGEAGDLRRHCGHFDVTVMLAPKQVYSNDGCPRTREISLTWAYEKSGDTETRSLWQGTCRLNAGFSFRKQR